MSHQFPVTRTTHPKPKPDQTNLGFGKYFTDHMFIMDYSDEKGWYDPRIVPFQNISLSPAACVFHYGAEVFEGLKAYRRPDGEVQLFRPWDNMERMKNSAIRRYPAAAAQSARASAWAESSFKTRSQEGKSVISPPRAWTSAGSPWFHMTTRLSWKSKSGWSLK